jgi:hypothetical protein
MSDVIFNLTAIRPDALPVSTWVRGWSEVQRRVAYWIDCYELTPRSPVFVFAPEGERELLQYTVQQIVEAQLDEPR